MGSPNGFAWHQQGDDVDITHHGRHAVMLRGDRARGFLIEVESGDAQLLMAQLTGNYKRGNERSIRPRNR